MIVHLAENDSGEPEKIFKGKGSYKNGHYIVKKNTLERRLSILGF